MKKITLINNFDYISIILGITFALFFGLLFLGKKGFVFDEVFSILSAKNWNSMWHLLWKEEGNMWLYIILMHFWSKLGNSEFVIRSLSVIFATATIPINYLLIKELFNHRLARITTILIPINLFFIYYSQEARGYSQLLFLSILSSYFFVKIIKKGNLNNFIGYTLIIVLAIYSHLYGLFVISAQLFSLLLINKKKLFPYNKLIISLICIVILLLPLITAPSFKSGQINWLQKPHINSLVRPFILFSSDFHPIFFIDIFLISCYLFFFRKKLFEWKYAFIELLLFLPILFSFFFSILIKPIYLSVYFITCLIPFTTIVSLAITKIPSKFLSKTLLNLIVLFSLLRLYGWYSGNTKLSWIIENNNDDWRGTVNYVWLNTGFKDAVVFYSYFNREPFEFYFDKIRPNNIKKSLDIIEISSKPYLKGGGNQLPKPNQSLLLSLANRYSRIWVILNNDEGLYLNRDYQKKIILQQLSKNYILKERVEFTNIKVLLYEKSSAI